MSQSSNKKEERVFTIELRSKGDVKNVSLDGNEKVFIEGSLGTLERAQFVDDLVLQVIGSNGELRVDLGSMDIQKPKTVGASDWGNKR
jgi:hypothetical protein